MNDETVIITSELKVEDRLMDLESWNQEWRREDVYLAQLVDQLDVTKASDRQKGVRIGNLRRRNETKLVAKPLEVEVTILQKVGYPELRRNLVYQFVKLTREQKLVWLLNFLFIITPSLRELIQKIQNLQSYRSLGQQRNLLLGGPSGAGKTTLLNWVTASHRPVVEQIRNIVPIVKVDAPRSQRSSSVLFQRIILELGHTYLKSAKDEELLQILVVLFQQCRVQMLIIDEIEHLIKDEFRRRLLEVSNLTHGVPIICASCNPRRWVEGDAEVSGRWNDYFLLGQLTGVKLSSFLAYIELLLPFSQSSYLPEFQLELNGEKVDGPAKLIERLTGGILRDIMILIADASKKAIESNQNCLSPELLKKSWDDIQKEQVTDFLQVLNLKA